MRRVGDRPASSVFSQYIDPGAPPLRSEASEGPLVLQSRLAGRGFQFIVTEPPKTQTLGGRRKTSAVRGKQLVLDHLRELSLALVESSLVPGHFEARVGGVRELKEALSSRPRLEKHLGGSCV